MDRVPVCLSIAGSDSGGGAGIQADLKAFWDHGFVGATAITSVTSQHTRGVTRVDPVPVDGVVSQLAAVFDDLEVAAVKIGMLGTAAHVSVVADVLGSLFGGPPIVLDPVMVATSGDRLLDDTAVQVMVERLVPLATLITPNLPEAAVLTDFGADLSRWAVLTTGGDADTEDVVDALRTFRGDRTWRHARLPGGPFHGTGCTLSSAIAARLARGERLEDAVDGGIAYVRRRLEASVAIGGGSRVGGPLTTPA